MKLLKTHFFFVLFFLNLNKTKTKTNEDLFFNNNFYNKRMDRK